MSRGPQASIEVQRLVARLVREGHRAPAIHQELERLGWPGMDRGMNVRTIQRMVGRFTADDDSEPWSFASADPEQTRLILDVLECALDTRGERQWPTKEWVRWAVHVRTAAPDIPPAWAHELAVAYQLFHSKDTRYLDLVLMFHPWRDEQSLEWFIRTVQRSGELLGEPDLLQWALLGVLSDEDLEKLSEPPRRMPRVMRAWG